MNLLPNPALIINDGAIFFEPQGGVAPYVFSLASGDGSIDPATGVYTAPGYPTSAVVQVTDSLGDTATAEIVVNTAIKIFCDILRSELGLAGDQVFLWSQKVFIPQDQRLYITVGIREFKCFSNSNVTQDDGAGGLNEVQSANFRAVLSIDLMSRGPDARDRKEQVVLALGSTYSKQQQSMNGFYIARLPENFLNLSAVDGAAIPHRFHSGAAVQYAVTKTKAVPFFDTFDDPTLTTEP